MELSIYGRAMNYLTRSAAAISSLYTSLRSEIEHQLNQRVPGSAEELTGNRLTRSHIESYLHENRQYLANSYQGLAVVQTAQQQTYRIRLKLEEMEELAELAASGQYSEEEIEHLQQEFETLLGEIDQIAIGTHPGGFSMLCSTAFGTVGVEVDRDQKVEIDSMDMTVNGLGVVQSMNLTTAPEETLSAVQEAIDEVSAYQQHLEESRKALESALDILNDERESLQPALASVSERRSARQALASITGISSESESLLLAAQARVKSDRAIQLLLEESE